MKILVVDDEAVSRKKMIKIMGEFGDCYMAESGLAAIKSFNDAWALGMPFELVMLDISMPDISGIEVLKQIRQVEKNKALAKAYRVKVVMVSSHSDKDIVVDSMEAGCNNYIVKPFDRELVVEKLSNIGYAPDGEIKNDARV